MESTELYHIRQQFTLGAYKSLASLTIPDPSSEEYSATLLYHARALIALNETGKALSVIPENTEILSLKAARSLARYVRASAAGNDEKDNALEELRDLCVEIESEDVDEKERGSVRVLAGTAFAREGEVEEALETLGAGSSNENLEATSLTVQIYLSIDRPDLAKKEYERALKWADDDLLLQHIEATIGLKTGTDKYSNTYSFYTEQIGNPSVSSPHLLTSRGITRLMRGEINEAKSDLEEAMKSEESAETLSAFVVAAGLSSSKKGEADELFAKLSEKYPEHPLVIDLAQKSSLFDQCAANFEIPPRAVPAAA